MAAFIVATGPRRPLKLPGADVYVGPIVSAAVSSSSDPTIQRRCCSTILICRHMRLQQMTKEPTPKCARCDRPIEDIHDVYTLWQRSGECIEVCLSCCLDDTLDYDEEED